MRSKIGFALFLVLVVTACFKIPAQRPLSPLSWDVNGCTLGWTGQYTGETQRQCYRDWKWREATVLTTCPDGERSGLLCYPPCREGYSGTGPVCWKDCPPGYTDDGVTCRKNAHIIAAERDCPWYDVCGVGLARGCSTCPEGYANDGCTCRRDPHIIGQESHTRGVGWPMSCAEGKQQLGALCYGDCPSGYQADNVYCQALEETCMDIPVKTPPDRSQLELYCFKMLDPDNWSDPCDTWLTEADTQAHADELARCRYPYAQIERIACSAFYADTACK